VGGVLTRADWRSLHLTNPFRNQESPALPPDPAPMPANSQIAANPQGATNSPSNDSQPSQKESVPAQLERPVLLPVKDFGSPPAFVTVRPNQTMYRICIETLGSYDEEIRAQLQKLNPEISDFTRIEVGQKIRMPAAEGVSRFNRVIAAQQSTLQPVKVEKP
jgi:hypothetical protein